LQVQDQESRPKPLRYIDNPALLAESLDELKLATELAFDLEFDSHRHAYGVTLCLIQISSDTLCYVIDPFAISDLKGVFDLFEDPSILKITHSPGEDLRLLHSLKCIPRNLFDTEAAARLLNYEQTSLATMLAQKLNIELNKQQQRSNWLRRPLTDQQLEYAADDVAFLHQLRKVLLDEAREKELLELVEAEASELGSIVYEPEEKSFFLKSGDLRAMSPFEQHVLNGLFQYRDGLARHLNKPAYQVLDEAVLRALNDGSLRPEDLPNTKGVYGHYRNASFADRLERRMSALKNEARQQGLDTQLPARPHFTSEERESRARADRDRDEKFAPVQQELARKFGANAARFILSNGNVNEILKKSSTLNELKRGYKSKLIQDTAKDLGVDLTDYVG
jgi:ribonuclease D